MAKQPTEDFDTYEGGEASNDGGNLLDLEKDTSFQQQATDTSYDVDSSTSTNQSSISLELNPTSTQEEADAPGIALLRQIFPDESTEELRRLHHQHVRKQRREHQVEDTSHDTSSSTPTSLPSSNLGRRVFQAYNRANACASTLEWHPMPLPEDFLRLPQSVAVRWTTGRGEGGQENSKQYVFLDDLQQQALQEHFLFSQRVSGATPAGTTAVMPDNPNYYSVAIERHPELGLGLALKEVQNRLYVHGFIESPDSPSVQHMGTIHPEDALVGINGSAAMLWPPLQASPNPHYSPLEGMVHAIEQSPNPVVLHFERSKSVVVSAFPPIQRNTSLLDASDDAESIASVSTITTNATASTTGAPAVRTPPRPNFPRAQAALSRLRRRQAPTAPPTATHPADPMDAIDIHPFAKALTKRGLIRNPLQDERQISIHLQQFTDRTRQWEMTSSLRIDAISHMVVSHFDPHDLPPDIAALVLPDETDNTQNVDSSMTTPSTPTLPPNSQLIPQEYRVAFYGEPEEEAHKPPARAPIPDPNAPHRTRFPNFPTNRGRNQQAVVPQGISNRQDVIFLPLYHVRKALSTRVVNSFIDEERRVAYTLWVYDVETAKEWYAPIRYWQDFCELRAACIALAPPQAGVEEWEFPKVKGLGFRAGNPNGLFFGGLRDNNGVPKAEPDNVRQTKCRQLEHFLRNLCSLIYTCEPLHPDVAEMAIHVQSFLGVEAGLADDSTAKEEAALTRPPPVGHDDHQWQVRQQLKTSLQRYTYRLFMLNVMRAIVDDFVDAALERAPNLREIESHEVRATLKSRAMEDLERVRSFLDQLVDLIVEGCQEEMKSISQRRQYFLLHSLLEGGESSYWERLLRESVREQVEIEVYVPLRTVVSRLLVNGWRHEDMEVQFKIKELRKRPQEMFRIPPNQFSPSHWQSVATILKRGVGMSTLPCSKLRAIVDAAREVSHVYKFEHSGDCDMGADDFLPIFIYCVVHADLERPCALCLLLTTLCDRLNQIGEIGYYLASFEAAITHIQETDLTEDSLQSDDALSFLSVPLTEVSLNE